MGRCSASLNPVGDSIPSSHPSGLSVHNLKKVPVSSMVTGTDKTHIHTDEDEATSRRQAEVAAVDQAMDMVADDMPVLSGSATSSSKAENRFGQRAAQGLKQSSTAADAGTCISTTPPPPLPAYPLQKLQCP